MPVKLNRLKKTKQSNTCAVGILLCLLSLTALFNILFNGNRQKKQCLGFGVLSSSLNSQRRNAIRNGWGKHPGVCRLTFFVAINSDLALMEKVLREASETKDIVLVNVKEAYHNITHQTLAIHSSVPMDPLVTHVVKVDDDTFVRVALLSEYIKDLGVSNGKNSLIYVGNVEYVSSPDRSPSSPWYISPDQWPSSKYPPWAHGACYVLSADLSRNIGSGAAILSLNGDILPLEDISTAVWVDYLRRTNINTNVVILHDTRFNFMRGQCRDTDFATHYVDAVVQTCLSSSQGSCSSCYL